MTQTGQVFFLAEDGALWEACSFVDENGYTSTEWHPVEPS
jgi:hypothetical protein